MLFIYFLPHWHILCVFYVDNASSLLIFRYFDWKQEDKKYKQEKQFLQCRYSVIAHIFIIQTQ